MHAHPVHLFTSIFSWISSLRSMTHQEFQSVFRSILKSFLNCVEGLQALNGNITQVIEDIRSVTETRSTSFTHSCHLLGHQHYHPSSRRYTILCSTHCPPQQSPRTC